MKSILYVAATLMIGASIYGFVDYSKTSRHNEFKTMYDENDVKKPSVNDKKEMREITESGTQGKKDQAVISTNEPEEKPVKKIKKKRTVDVESFSRAPLREKEVVLVPEKKELKVKEQ